MEDAVSHKVVDANAMTLATATKEGLPSSRTVLLKAIEEDAVLFFTNTLSRKGREIEENPYAAATIWWKELFRQVNMEGRVGKTSRKEAEEYFWTRPRGSQIAAYASTQGEVLKDRDEIIEKFQRIEHQFAGERIPLPPHWGGYRLFPSHVEFWKGRESRLHDRFSYRLNKGKWIIERISP